MPDLNKPTGLGYQGTWTRVCTICGYPEIKHYGKMGLLVEGEWCPGFAARDMTPEEIELVIHPPKPQALTEHVGDSFDYELRREIDRQKYAPIPKLPQLTKAQINEANRALEAIKD